MKIIGWTSFENQEIHELYPDEEHPTAEDINNVETIIADELRKRGYKFSGYYHQGGEYGCPVFDCGKWYGVSFRRWGAIMAKAYPELVDTLDPVVWYVNWAWLPPEGETEVYPNPNDYAEYQEDRFIPMSAALLDEIFQYGSWPWYQKLYYRMSELASAVHLWWLNHVMKHVWAWMERRKTR